MLKILIAEDDLMIADMTENFLAENGYEVCGIARTVSRAVELAQTFKPDLALIDMRLAESGVGTQIAAGLAPFVGLGILYASGNTLQGMLTRADGHGYLLKPYTFPDLLRALVLVCASSNDLRQSVA
jgi:response regulator of citrate/malate metabolism